MLRYFSTVFVKNSCILNVWKKPNSIIFISVCPSVCLSVRMKQMCCHCTGFSAVLLCSSKRYGKEFFASIKTCKFLKPAPMLCYTYIICHFVIWPLFCCGVALWWIWRNCNRCFTFCNYVVCWRILWQATVNMFICMTYCECQCNF